MRQVVAALAVLLLIAGFTSSSTEFSPSVHAFFYLWYGTPEFDGKYTHWNHKVLPHMEEEVNARHQSIGQKHNPPENIHSSYYPLQNPYSTKDPKILARQFADMHTAKISVAVVSWWGQSDNEHATDRQGVKSDLVMHDVFRAADKNGQIKIAFHLEPYRSRTIESIRSDIDYIIRTYGRYSSMFRNQDGRPMFYVYDSYLMDTAQWHRMLDLSGDITIRGTALDSIIIGLWLQSHDGYALKNGGFDGVYTYFASDGLSYGASTNHWDEIAEFSRLNNLVCSLSVGPGYEDSTIRPWNTHHGKQRRDGDYYIEMWEAAINANPTVVSITSYNEWGEGTQIEPAKEVRDFHSAGKDYQNYGEGGPNFYLNLTTVHAHEFYLMKARQHREL